MGPDLQALVDNFDVLARTVQSDQPRVNTLVENSRSLFTANEENVDALPEVALTLRQLTDQVRNSDPQLRTLLDRSPSVLDNQILPLIEQSREPFSLLLANSLVSTQIVTARMPAVDALLVVVPKGFEKFGSIVKDGRAQLDLITALGPVCIYDTPPAIGTGHLTDHARQGPTLRGPVGPDPESRFAERPHRSWNDRRGC